MDWIPVTERKPPQGEEVGVYDAFHIGLSSGRFDGEAFEVEDSGGRGTFVTHWCDNPNPTGAPDSEDVHRVCKQSF